MALPVFTWCPAPGMGKEAKPRLEVIQYGDGYTHRLTRGINIQEVLLSCTFNGDGSYIGAIEQFLAANYLKGFIFQWANNTQVTCDGWSYTVLDKMNNGQTIASMTAQFRQAHNVQPT